MAAIVVTVVFWAVLSGPSTFDNTFDGTPSRSSLPFLILNVYVTHSMVQYICTRAEHCIRPLRDHTDKCAPSTIDIPSPKRRAPSLLFGSSIHYQCDTSFLQSVVSSSFTFRISKLKTPASIRLS